jgi:23S rRNA (uracil1939-C5)-methyltransferase
VGLFSLALASSFRQVTAVEESRVAFRDLRRNAAANVTAVQASTEAFLSRRGAAAGYDHALLDPPRRGLGEAAARALAATGVRGITYVSCDPATLARDARVLLEAGFAIAEARLLDLFPQTFHMETVLRLVR